MKRMAGIPDKTVLWVVRVDLQIGEEKWFAARFMTSPVGLDSYEYRIDLRQRFRVVTL